MASLLNKVLRTSPHELLTRSGQKAFRVWERLRYRSQSRPFDDSEYQRRVRIAASDAATVRKRFGADGPARFFLPHGDEARGLRELIEREFPEIRESSVLHADRVLRHEFEFLGIETRYDGRIPWNLDPVSRREWPRVFFGDVDIFGGDRGHGDVKHVWELNRHQFLVDLGKAHWLTGDSTYADAFVELVDSWIEDNPYNTGVNWSSTLEHAYRALAWIWTWHFCLDAVPAEFGRRFLEAVYRHGYYIHRHLSFYHSPYNHLIGEATALFAIGALFPEFDEAERWAERGWSVLDRELENQLHVDGGTVEQASFYHYATLGFYTIAALLRRRNGWPVRSGILERIERAIEFSVHLHQPDGRIPRIGDVDDARPVRHERRPLWDFREFHSIGAVLFERPDFKWASGGFSEDALWLLGREGYETFSRLDSAPPEPISRGFPESGYWFFRSGWSDKDHWACFDCGEQAAGLHTSDIVSSAHGHADALSVLATAGEHPVLVGSGFYTYNGEAAWRDYFRQTRSANTVVVDGRDQSTHHGNMAWSNVARASLEHEERSDDVQYVCGSHDGYAHAGAPVVHRRALVFHKSFYWLILDELAGVGHHDVESWLHLAPGTATPGDDGEVRVDLESGSVAVLRVAGAPLTPEVLSSSLPERPESGWIATSYGCRTPAPVVCFRGRFEVPARWATLVAPGREDLTLEAKEGCWRVRGSDVDDEYRWSPPRIEHVNHRVPEVNRNA